MLSEWYGESGAPGAMFRHLGSPRSLETVLNDLTRKLAPPWQRILCLLDSRWGEIVGKAAAKHCRAVRFDGTVLWIELAHPAYRMALDTPPMKEALVRKINTVTGEDCCDTIRFIAAGSVAPDRKK